MKKNLIKFADKALGRKFVADLNFAFAAIWDLSCGNINICIPKENIIILSNHYEHQEIRFITEDGAIWDDIFEELKNEGLIDLDMDFVRINQLTIDLIVNMAA